MPNQRAGGGSGWAGRAPQSARHLNFGASSSSAAGRGGNGVVSVTGAAAVGRQRANTAATAPVSAPNRHRTAHSNSSQRGGGAQRGRVSRPPAPRNGGINISGSVQPINDDEELSDDVEELGSSGGHLVSQGSRAFWSDENNACLLQLALE